MTTMKKLIFIALLLSFLMGNAQQDRQQSGPKITKAPVQLNTDNNAGYPIEIDLNRYTIRKPDNDPTPILFDLNRYTMKKPDKHPGYPNESDLNRYTMKKPN